jgi:ATP-binding cassette, subfamily B, bacterial CvaB/MchF/RaxB
MQTQRPGLGMFGARSSLPVILQTEAAECGLACLAMIACYYQLQTDLASLRRRFSVSLKGATLKSLIAMAKALQLTTRPLKLDLEHLADLKLPCVLHWDMNHFVVLKSVSGSRVRIHDPAVGERSVSLQEFGKHFSGIALEVAPGTDFVPAKQIQRFTILGLMGRVVGLRRGLAQIILLAVALEVTFVVAPLYMQFLIDQALVAADRNLITVLGLGFILLVVIQASISAFRAWAIAVLNINLNFQWFGNVFAHLLRLPLEYFEKRHLGDIVSRFGSVATIQKTITTGFVQAIVDGMLAISMLAMMVLYSAKLAAIALIAVILYGLLRWAVFRPLRDATAEQIIHAAKQQTHFLESARGAQALRLFGRNEERRVGWMNHLAEQFNAEVRIQRIAVSYQTANTLLFGIERVVLIWLAALAVIQSEFSVGMLFAFIAYKDQFSTRMAGLVDKAFEFRMLRLHGERLADIVLTETEQDHAADEIEDARIAPSIEVRNVSFRYSPLDPLVLDSVSFSIQAGESVAIAGASGCGKTTLVKVMLGLLNPAEGDVLVGGVPIKQLGLENFRRIVGTVMQEDSLFTGLISENITMFDPLPKQDRVEECARLAAIYDEICAMPMGFNTLVGDIGTGLSGGQKQRLLLARALYKSPRILVLDEATSHLDVVNEGAVNKAVRALNLTRIVVAHRPETLSMADRVLVLDRGKLVQELSIDHMRKQAAPLAAA